MLVFIRRSYSCIYIILTEKGILSLRLVMMIKIQSNNSCTRVLENLARSFKITINCIDNYPPESTNFKDNLYYYILCTIYIIHDGVIV